MHVLEKAFIDLLRNHLPISNDKIYTGNRYRPKDISPCVNLILADENFIRRRYVEIEQKQHIQQEYNVELWINVWCNTEEQRQELNDSIDLRIKQALANHYTTCNHYNINEQNCSITDESCEALTSQSGRANKNQCPDITKYQSFFNYNHILKRTFQCNVNDLDELNVSEPLLRTVFKLNMNYYNYYEIGGRTFTDFIFEETES